MAEGSNVSSCGIKKGDFEEHPYQKTVRSPANPYIYIYEKKLHGQGTCCKLPACFFQAAESFSLLCGRVAIRDQLYTLHPYW